MLRRFSPSLALTAAMLAIPLPALAVDKNLCNEAAGLTIDGGKCVPANSTGSGTGKELPQYLHLITDILVFIIGAASVIMIIIGGLRYVLSSGDAASAKSAKDTILYAVVGIIIAVLSFAIVAFVTGQLV